ncbi:MAG: 4Fe-4S dicluster domain-containing protein [Dehalococcoidales bacterium]|nr:4Fe-4S dicluster domain-containing protein [Dehalococcoidales bacterium]
MATNNVTITDKSGTQPVDASFAQQVRDESGEPLDRCYQCFTCSLGCPVSKYMDFHPDQVIRMVQLGLKQQVLTSEAVWICLGCETCVARCPNEIDVLRVMDTLREIALKENIKGKDESIPRFHKVFMLPIKYLGKQYELALFAIIILRTMDFGDLGLGIKMILRNKLPFFPARVKGLKQIRKIFEKTKLK